MSQEAKERLKPHLSEGNVRQTMEAPVTAIIGYDLDFARHLPSALSRQSQCPEPGSAMPRPTRCMRLRNGSLQGGYFILAARALGLDCGPMGGFDQCRGRCGILCRHRRSSRISSAIWAMAREGGFRPRNERLSFDEACQIL